jgi:hypothetical protein
VSDPNRSGAARARCRLRHLRIGWWSILAFLSLGILLEFLHASKAAWYLNEAFETRRHLWTLAHAHGVLLGVLHIAFAVSCLHLVGTERSLRIASGCLTGASVLLPGGFLLGGVVIYDGDPGLGIFLVPVAGALLFVSVLMTARMLVSTSDERG